MPVVVRSSRFACAGRLRPGGVVGFVLVAVGLSLAGCGRSGTASSSSRTSVRSSGDPSSSTQAPQTGGTSAAAAGPTPVGHISVGSSCPTVIQLNQVLGLTMRQYASVRSNGGVTCTFVPADSQEPPATAPIEMEFGSVANMSVSQYRAMTVPNQKACNGSPHALPQGLGSMTCLITNEPSLSPDAFEAYIIGSNSGVNAGSCNLAWAAGGRSQDLLMSIHGRPGGSALSADATPATLCGWVDKLAADT